MHDVAVLVAELRTAAETINHIQNRFLQPVIGCKWRWMIASAVAHSGDNIRVIRDSIREGFRLDEQPKRQAMKDGNFSFALISGRDEFEESFWPSFTDAMMVITMIFLIVTVAVVLTNTRLLDDLRHSVKAEQSAQQSAQKAAEEALQASRQAQKPNNWRNFNSKPMRVWKNNWNIYNNAAVVGNGIIAQPCHRQRRPAASERDALLSRLEAQQSEYGNTLKLREQSIAMLQTELNSKNTEIAGLTSKADQRKAITELAG